MAEQDVDANNISFKFFSFDWTISNINMLSSRLESPPFIVGNSDKNEWIMCLNIIEEKLVIEIKVISDDMELIKDNCFCLAVLDESGKVLKSEYGHMLEVPNTVTREENELSLPVLNLSECKVSNDTEVNSFFKFVSKPDMPESACDKSQHKFSCDDKKHIFKAPFPNNELDSDKSPEEKNAGSDSVSACLESNQRNWSFNKRVFNETVELGCINTFLCENTLYLRCNLGLKFSHSHGTCIQLNTATDIQAMHFPRKSPVSDNIQRLSRDLEKNFLKNTSFSDISSKANCNKFTAHKALLHCRCPRLLENLAENLQECSETKVKSLFYDSEKVKFCFENILLNDEGSQTRMKNTGSVMSCSKKKSRFRKIVGRIKHQRSSPSNSSKLQNPDVNYLISPDFQEYQSDKKTDLSSLLNSSQDPSSSGSVPETFSNSGPKTLHTSQSNEDIYAKKSSPNNCTISEDSELIYAIEPNGKLVLVNEEFNSEYSKILNEGQIFNETEPNFGLNDGNHSSCEELDYAKNFNDSIRKEYGFTIESSECDKNPLVESNDTSREVEDKMSLDDNFLASNHGVCEYTETSQWDSNESSSEAEYQSFSEVTAHEDDEDEIGAIASDLKPSYMDRTRLEYDYNHSDESLKSQTLENYKNTTELLKVISFSSDSLQPTDTNPNNLCSRSHSSKILPSGYVRSDNLYAYSGEESEHNIATENESNSDASKDDDCKNVKDVDFALEPKKKYIFRNKSDKIPSSNTHKSQDSVLQRKKPSFHTNSEYSNVWKFHDLKSFETAENVSKSSLSFSKSGFSDAARSQSSSSFSKSKYSDASKSQSIDSEDTNMLIPDIDEIHSECDCSETIKITDIDPHVFFWILRYIYSGKLDLHNQFLFKFTCFRVYKAAVKFGLKDLTMFLAPVTMRVKSRINIEKFSFSNIIDNFYTRNFFSWQCVTKSQSKIICSLSVSYLLQSTLVCQLSLVAFGTNNLHLNSKIQYTISLTLFQKNKQFILKPKTRTSFLSNEIYLPDVCFELDKEAEIDHQHIDSILMQCNIVLERGSSTDEVEGIYPHSTPELNEMNLSKDLRTLFISKKFTDISLQVEDENFDAHRFILSARSPEFARMLKNNPRNVIALENLEAETLENLLLYIYTGEVPDSSKGLLLYKASIRFCLKDLEEMCQRYMIDNLDKVDVCQILIFTHSHDDKLLERAAETYVCRYASKTLLSKSGMDMLQNYPSIAERILQKLSLVN